MDSFNTPLIVDYFKENVHILVMTDLWTDFFWLQQYTSKNTVPAQHVIEKEVETSFTLNQYTSPTQPSTAITASLSQW